MVERREERESEKRRERERERGGGNVCGAMERNVYVRAASRRVSLLLSVFRREGP